MEILAPKLLNEDDTPTIPLNPGFGFQWDFQIVSVIISHTACEIFRINSINGQSALYVFSLFQEERNG